jgi:putative transposase
MLDMGILKIEVNVPELRGALDTFRKKRIQGLEMITREIRAAAGNAIDQLMNAEMELFLGKPDQAGNKRNGYATREYAFKGLGLLRLRVPVDRRRTFESEVIPKSERIDPRIKEDMAVLHLAGLSKRDLEMISRRVLGVEVSRETVSQSLSLIQEKSLQWLQRPISGRYWALYIDGTNFKIQRRGSTEKEPSLVVLGVDAQDRKSILAIEPGSKDDASSWEAVFSELKRRGLDAQAVRVGLMDGLPGLETAFQSAFPKAVTARCWVHALKNAVAKAPARLRPSFKRLAGAVMYASSEAAAREAFRTLKEAMSADAKRAVRCLEKDLDSLLVHYRFDKRYWLALKTTNPIERVNKEFKKRARAMGSLGEGLQECLVAFTALRLEMGWKRFAIDTPHLANFVKLGDKANLIEQAVTTLIQ